MEEEKPENYPESNTESTQLKSNLENVEKNKSQENNEMKIEDEEKLTILKQAFTKFLSEHTIYEAIPEDMKILVFNDALLIKDSIEAMINEDIYCGLLYNSKDNKHSGIFTIRDVLGLLLIGYKKLVSFLNNEKNINSYETLKKKENLDKFFATFDDETEHLENIIDTIKMFNDILNNNDMDIEEENNNNNTNIITNANLNLNAGNNNSNNDSFKYSSSLNNRKRKSILNKRITFQSINNINENSEESYDSSCDTVKEEFEPKKLYTNIETQIRINYFFNYLYSPFFH